MVALLVALALVICAAAATCLHPRDTTAVSLHFGYSREEGPLTWAGIPSAHNSSADWSVCRLGRHQSPIVIYTDTLKPLPPGSVAVAISNVDAGKALLENLGTTLEVAGLMGVLKYGGMGYDFQQLHFHTPSEHRIDDEYFPLEMHLVFKAPDASLAVTGVLFQLGTSTTPNPLLTNIFLNLALVSNPHTNTTTGALDFSALTHNLTTTPSLFSYNGSLTTPPCTEGVAWFVLGEPQTGYLDVELYNAVKGVMKFNARYSQNGPGGVNLLELAREIGNNGTVLTSPTDIRFTSVQNWNFVKFYRRLVSIVYS
ncbi:carbonic anhydrase [Exidia glandulosa HHB12029]|uniref:Carbonic anhydrase n=1 Tax=Exidia glandulosa HHB12029 TaxID=1314781 RepID=A0A165EQ72_EXIGL|nr:carbonic anhydrase [Exidia glandulosa HHB12029]